MNEFTAIPLFTVAVAAAVFSVWTDIRKSEIPLFVPWVVLALGAAAWTIGDFQVLRSHVSGTVAATAVI